MATQPVRIRYCAREDFDSIVDIELKCFGGLPEQIAVDARYFVAELDGRVVGFSSFYLHQKAILLDCVAVYPYLHRNGIGTRLVERLAPYLSGERRNKVFCYVRESSLQTQQFFRSLDFMAIRRISKHIAGEPAYVFRFLNTQPPKLTTVNRMHDANETP